MSHVQPSFRHFQNIIKTIHEWNKCEQPLGAQCVRDEKNFNVRLRMSECRYFKLLKNYKIVQQQKN